MNGDDVRDSKQKRGETCHFLNIASTRACENCESRFHGSKNPLFFKLQLERHSDTPVPYGYDLEVLELQSTRKFYIILSSYSYKWLCDAKRKQERTETWTTNSNSKKERRVDDHNSCKTTNNSTSIESDSLYILVLILDL